MRAIFAVDGGNATGLAWGIFDDSAKSVEEALAGRLHTGSATLNRKVKKGGKTVTLEPHTDQEQIARIYREFFAFKRFAVRDCFIDPDWVDLVLEDFTLMPGAHAGGRDGVASVRIAWGVVGVQMGVWTEYHRRHHTLHVSEPVWQAPSRMSYATDERIKRWGLWIPGRDHERTAWKHIAIRLNDLIK